MKKTFFICLSVTVLFSSAVISGTVLFDDDFSENGNGWAVGETESAIIQMQGGKLYFECKGYLSNGGGAWIKVPDLKLPTSGFTMKCTTKWVKNRLTDDNYSPYGFIVGPYYFLVYADGERRLLSYDKVAKKYTTIVDWGNAYSIKRTTTGENKFEIVYRDGRAAFYCNGEMLFKKPITLTEEDNRLKLYTEKSEVVEFDDLKVTD